MDTLAGRLDITVTEGDPPTLRISGQAGFHNRHEMADAFRGLFNAGHHTVQVDMSNLRYIDSSGVSTLVSCFMMATECGHRIEITGVSEQVNRVLTICGAAAFFTYAGHRTPERSGQDPTPPSETYWHVSDFSLPATPEAAAVARGRVADVVRSLPLSHGARHDVLVAVGEALTNAVRHGCGCDPELRVAVRCVAGPRRLAIEIIDPGAGFDPEEVARRKPRNLMEGGMGIMMMRQLMDEVAFTFHGCTVARLVKYTPGADDAPGGPVDAITETHEILTR